MLKQRILTALVLLAILLPALFHPSPVAFTAVILVLMAAAAWEWGRLNACGPVGAVLVGAACLALCAASWALGWVQRPLGVLWLAGGGCWVLGSAWLLRAGVPGWPRVPAALRLVAGIVLVVGVSLVAQRIARPDQVPEAALEAVADVSTVESQPFLSRWLRTLWQLFWSTIPVYILAVLILGAGGAARGSVLPVAEAGPARLVIVNRTQAKAEARRAQFAGVAAVDVEPCDGLAGQRFDLVINATSAGLHGESLPLPAGIFAPGALAYDMVYGSTETPFMVAARALGASRVSDGLGMLVGQAAESFFLWRGVRPDTAPVLQMLQAG